MSDKINVFASFYPKENYLNDVQKILANMVELTRAEPGCYQYDFFKSNTGNSFHLVECYAGQSALAAHRETEHYKTYRKLIEALLEKPITVTVMEEIDVKR